MSASFAPPVIAELGTIVLACVLVYAAGKRFGYVKTIIFLGGAILWTALIENLSVVAGEYTYYDFANKLIQGYPGYLFWVGAVPLWVLLGWFVLAMSGFVIFHEILLPQRRALFQAAASALLAVNVDLMLDPAASANSLWVWLSGYYRYLGVPVVNFLGWFLLIFFYDIIAGHTIFRSSPLPVLSRIERAVFGELNEGSPVPDLRRFAFRLVVLEILIFGALYYFAGFLDFIAAGGL